MICKPNSKKNKYRTSLSYFTLEKSSAINGTDHITQPLPDCDVITIRINDAKMKDINNLKFIILSLKKIKIRKPYIIGDQKNILSPICELKTNSLSSSVMARASTPRN